jgi:hypothetical protein
MDHGVEALKCGGMQASFGLGWVPVDGGAVDVTMTPHEAVHFDSLLSRSAAKASADQPGCPADENAPDLIHRSLSV